MAKGLNDSFLEFINSGSKIYVPINNKIEQENFS